jgi:LemA protein
VIETVEGEADFEQSVLTEVTEARTNWLNTSADPESTISDQMASSNSFDSALSRLLVTVESYPVLTATEGFETLIVELEGTENRIAVARQDYNAVATTYNITTKQFPMMFFASLFGFNEHPLFESEEGSEDAPTVDFDFGDDE